MCALEQLRTVIRVCRDKNNREMPNSGKHTKRKPIWLPQTINRGMCNKAGWYDEASYIVRFI